MAGYMIVLYKYHTTDHFVKKQINGMVQADNRERALSEWSYRGAYHHFSIKCLARCTNELSFGCMLRNSCRRMSESTESLITGVRGKQVAYAEFAQ